MAVAFRPKAANMPSGCDGAGMPSSAGHEFDNTEEWWLSIPEDRRPHKDQPFYHLFAENAESEYIAYVSEQNLLPDESGDPVRHPQVSELFDLDDNGGYRLHPTLLN
jgi:heat shock protein HspQ